MYRLVLISLPHSLKSKVRLASYWIGRWGRPCGARTSEHAIAPSNGPRHYGGPYTTGGGGGDNIQSGPEGHIFPGIVTTSHQYQTLYSTPPWLDAHTSKVSRKYSNAFWSYSAKTKRDGQTDRRTGGVAISPVPGLWRRREIITGGGGGGGGALQDVGIKTYLDLHDMKLLPNMT